MVENNLENETREASCLQLFSAFVRLGLFTIGGGMAMVPILQDMVVDKYKWMTREETLDCIAISQSLPGVVAINMATYTGSRKRGLCGAFCATAGVMLPSIVIICLVAAFLGQIDQNVYVMGALSGIRSAAAGLIAWATYRMGKQVLKDADWFAWTLAAASLITVGILGFSAVWAILGGMLLGILHYTLTNGKLRRDKSAGASKDGEESDRK